MFETTENSGTFNVTDLPDLRSHGQTLTKVEVQDSNECVKFGPLSCSSVVLSGDILVLENGESTVIATYAVTLTQASSTPTSQSTVQSDLYVNMESRSIFSQERGNPVPK